MSEDLEHEKEREAREITFFYKGARVLIPWALTMLLTIVGWGYTAYQAAKERGAAEEKELQQEKTIATLAANQKMMQMRLNGHDVVLGKFEVQLARIEKTGDETNRLLNDFLRNR